MLKRFIYTVAISAAAVMELVSPGFSQCVAPKIIGDGTWNSVWSSPTGKYTSTVQTKIVNTERIGRADYDFGLYGTYNNGYFKGRYIDTKLTHVAGYWYSTQSKCSYGKFDFQLVNGMIKGKWGYCNSSPKWEWDLTQPCNDVKLNPVHGEVLPRFFKRA